MRLPLAFALLLLAGCTGAPGTSTPPQSAPATIRSTSEGFDIQTSASGGASVYRVSAPPQQVWPVLVKFYSDQGIPFTVFDPASWTAGSQNLRVSRRWGGAPVATILDCGAVAGAPIANSYPVRLNLLTSLVPAEGGATEVRIQTEGIASNPAAGSSAVRCATTGKLEQRIVEVLRGGTGK